MRAVPVQIAARLPAAAELFADRGVESTKIEDVAAATGSSASFVPNSR